jgi:hypothetical protein
VLLANGQTISYVLAAVSSFVAVLTYRKNSAFERARWLASLYSKFYEALDLKRIRRSLDDSSPNSPQVRELIQQEDAGFTDYLNFFEFMAYLEDCGQLSRRDVAALFDYYLRVLAKHEDVRQYNTERQERIRLSEETAAAFLVLTITGSSHDAPPFCIWHFIPAPRTAGDRRHRPSASPGGAGVGSRPPVRPW